MAKQDRLSIDLKGLREVIQNYRSDSAWEALSFAAKIRVMIVDANEARHNSRGESPTIAQIVCDHWEGVIGAGLDISGKRLKEIRSGSKPTDSELVELGTALPYDTHQLIEVRDRNFGRSNGQPVTDKV